MDNGGCKYNCKSCDHTSFLLPIRHNKLTHKKKIAFFGFLSFQNGFCSTQAQAPLRHLHH